MSNEWNVSERGQCKELLHTARSLGKLDKNAHEPMKFYRQSPTLFLLLFKIQKVYIFFSTSTKYVDW